MRLWILRVFEFCPTIPIFYEPNFKYMIIKPVSIFIMVNLLLMHTLFGITIFRRNLYPSGLWKACWFLFIFSGTLFTLDLNWHVLNFAWHLASQVFWERWYLGTEVSSAIERLQQFFKGNISFEPGCSQCSCSGIMFYNPAVFCWHYLICWPVLETTLTLSGD